MLSILKQNSKILDKNRLTKIKIFYINLCDILIMQITINFIRICLIKFML